MYRIHLSPYTFRQIIISGIFHTLASEQRRENKPRETDTHVRGRSRAEPTPLHHTHKEGTQKYTTVEVKGD